MPLIFLSEDQFIVLEYINGYRPAADYHNLYRKIVSETNLVKSQIDSIILDLLKSDCIEKYNEVKGKFIVTNDGHRLMNLRRVLRTIYDLAQDGNTRPNHQDIADKLEMEIIRVNNFLTQLKKRGYVSFLNPPGSLPDIVWIKGIEPPGEAALFNPSDLESDEKYGRLVNNIGGDINTNSGTGIINTGSGDVSGSVNYSTEAEKSLGSALEPIRSYILLLAAVIGLVSASMTLISILVK